jgi:hypothetical protein
LDSLVPCSRLIFAVVLPDAPAPTLRASRTNTFLPARANRTAVVNPVMPAPTTTTSADGSSSAVTEVVGTSFRPASHSEVIGVIGTILVSKNGLRPQPHSPIRGTA